VCGDQDKALSKSSMSNTYTSDSIGSGTVCWYEIEASASDISQVTIKVDTLTSATLEVYYATSSSAAPRALRGSQGVESKKYDIASKAYLYVLVTPTANNAKVVFTATGNGATSSSRRRGGSSGAGLILAIVLPTVCCVLVVIVLPVILLRIYIHKQRRANLENVRNMNMQNAAQVVEPSQQNQNGIYYEPSPYNATVQYINTDQSAINNSTWGFDYLGRLEICAPS